MEGLRVEGVDEEGFGLIGLGEAAPERQEAGEGLDAQREGVPGHVHAALDGGDEFGAAVDALDVGGVVEAVAGIPAEFLDLLAELEGLGTEALGVCEAAE